MYNCKAALPPNGGIQRGEAYNTISSYSVLFNLFGCMIVGKIANPTGTNANWQLYRKDWQLSQYICQLAFVPVQIPIAICPGTIASRTRFSCVP